MLFVYKGCHLLSLPHSVCAHKQSLLFSNCVDIKPVHCKHPSDEYYCELSQLCVARNRSCNCANPDFYSLPACLTHNNDFTTVGQQQEWIFPIYKKINRTVITLTQSSDQAYYYLPVIEPHTNINKFDIIALEHDKIALPSLCERKTTAPWQQTAMMWVNVFLKEDYLNFDGNNGKVHHDIVCYIAAIFSQNVQLSPPSVILNKISTGLSHGIYDLLLFDERFHKPIGKMNFEVQDPVENVILILPHNLIVTTGQKVVFLLATNRNTKVWCNWTLDNSTVAYSSLCPSPFDASLAECRLYGLQFAYWEHIFSKASEKETLCFTSRNEVSKLDSCFHLTIVDPITSLQLSSNSPLMVSPGLVSQGIFWVETTSGSNVIYEWMYLDNKRMSSQSTFIVPVTEAGEYIVTLKAYNNVSEYYSSLKLLAYEIIQGASISLNNFNGNVLKTNMTYTFSVEKETGSNVSYYWLLDETSVGNEKCVSLLFEKSDIKILRVLAKNKISESSASLRIFVEDPITDSHIKPIFKVINAGATIQFNIYISTGTQPKCEWFLCSGYIETCNLIGHDFNISITFPSTGHVVVKAHVFNNVSSQWLISDVVIVADNDDLNLFNTSFLENQETTSYAVEAKDEQVTALPIIDAQIMGCCKAPVMVSEIVTFYAVITNGSPIYYNWTIKEGQTAISYNSQNLTISFNRTGTLMIILIASNAVSMAKDAELIEVIPAIITEVTIHSDHDLESIYEGQAVTLFAVPKPTVAPVYIWIVNGIDQGINSATLELAYLSEGTYVVTVNASTDSSSATNEINFKVYTTACRPPNLIIVGGSVSSFLFKMYNC